MTQHPNQMPTTQTQLTSDTFALGAFLEAWAPPTRCRCPYTHTHTLSLSLSPPTRCRCPYTHTLSLSLSLFLSLSLASHQV